MWVPAVVAILVKILPLISPETCSSQMPLPPLAEMTKAYFALNKYDIETRIAEHGGKVVRYGQQAMVQAPMPH